MDANKIKQIIEAAIPLTMDCEVKRSVELARRAKLRVEIESLVRQPGFDPREPSKDGPELEYKGQVEVIGIRIA